jgi:hypothetical protein
LLVLLSEVELLRMSTTAGGKRNAIRSGSIETRNPNLDVPPWNRSYWEVLKSGLKAHQMSNTELLTKLDFFCQ